jgi:hypothetical protein
MHDIEATVDFIIRHGAGVFFVFLLLVALLIFAIVKAFKSRGGGGGGGTGINYTPTHYK